MANLLINTTVGGNAVITTSNIGTYALTSITSANVTTALGFTPYNATNPSGFITSSGSISGNAATATLATLASTVTINYNNDSNSSYQLLWGSGNSVYGTANIYVNPNSDTIYASAYRGNANVGGTGEAIYAPAGVYSTGINWLYGTMFMAGNTINEVSQLAMNGTNSVPINITGASHKYITINPGNGYEAMVRYIGGTGSSWYVGKRTSGQLVGTESFHFYSEAAGATVGGINPSGDMIVTGSMRAPIFYDSADTSYYVDPAGVSRIYRLQVIGDWAGSNPNEGAINIRGNYPSMTFRNIVSGNMWLRHMDGDGHIQHYFAPSGVDATNWGIKHTMFTNGNFYSLGTHTASQFNGSGAGLTGTASSLNVGSLGGYSLDTVKKYIWSRGENLLTNGTGLMGNNTNFSSFTFDGSQAYFSSGSFKYTGQFQAPNTDELMPVNPEKRYRLDFWARTLNGQGAYYAYLNFFDVDGNTITAVNHMYYPNTLTTLAQTLNPGDTIVYLTNAANWENGGTAGVSTHIRSFIFWNYVNSFGYAYPPLTYSQNWYGGRWNPGAISNNTITLISPWNGPSIAAGTQLSNGSAGGTFKYIALGFTIVPTVFTNYVGIMDGVDYTGSNAGGKFPPGTASAKLGFLTDYNASGDTIFLANLFVGVDNDYPIYDKWTGNTRIEKSGAFYGTIFYDSNNDAYYLNPNATSNLHTVNALNTNVGNAIYFGGGNNYLNWSGSAIASNVGIQSSVDMRAPIFYDSQDTNFYLDPNSTSRLGTLNINQLSVYGNTYLGDGNGDEVHINDILRVGATDSGDAHFYFGEGGLAGSDYGSHWYWDSGYRFTWYTRNAGTDTTLFYYDTNSLSYITWGRSISMNSNSIDYTGQLHFSGGTRFQSIDNHYLKFRTDATDYGSIQVRDANETIRGYLGYFDGSGFGLLNSAGSWGIRLAPGNSTTELFFAGDWRVQTASGGTKINGNLYTNSNYGHGLVGLYSSVRYQGVFAMGDDYKLAADGLTTGNLYGIAWTHTNVGGQSKSGLGHQALFMDNGVTQTAIGTGIWTNGLITTTSYGTSSNWNTAFGWGNHASAGYLTSITSGNVTTALGFTPYNATNPNGYITGISFANVSSKPTTLSGYGITDALYQNRDTINVDTFNPTGLYRGSTSGWSNRPTIVHNGGALLTIDTHPGDYHSQLFFDTGGDRLYFRNANAGSWGSWLTMFHTGNYTSYVPTLTGTGASGTWSINVTGNAGTATSAARATRANGNFYIDDNYGHSIVGLYNATILQGVFAMGDAYKLTAGGGAGNLYGLAWSHPNAGGVASNLNTHGLLVMENGTFLAAISGSIRARDDMRSPIFYDSQDTTYYLDPNSNSYLSTLRVANATSGVSLHVGLGSTHGVYTADNDRNYLVVSATYYPHMALVATSSNNSNHGAVFSFVGSESGAARQWNLGISNTDPFVFSIGYNRSGDNNPHYGIGDGWHGDDNHHARLSIDRSGNTKIRGMLYINGTSGGISTGSAVIHAGNIGSQSVNFATTAGALSSMNISQFSNNSGYITSSGSISGNAGSVTNGVYTTGDQTIGGLKTFSSNITNSATAEWYMYGFGARGASAGQYGIGLTDNIANRTLSFHVPNIAGYSNSGNTPKFGWYSNGSVELMSLQSATGNLVVTGTISASNLSGTNTGDQTNISGNAATATTAGSAGQVTHNAGRTDGTFYNVGWFASNPSPAYSCNAVQIQSSTGTLNATNLAATRSYAAIAPTVANGNWNTSFGNTPVSTMAWGGDISVGGPTGTWWFQVNMRHSNPSNLWGTQLAYGWEDNANEIYQRNVQGGTFSGWVRYINTNNFAGILDARYYTETEVNSLLSAKQDLSTAITTSNIGSQSVSNASSLAGLSVHAARNNEANKVVRTDGNGYLNTGWINTPSGVFASAITKIYCSDDDYIRFQTPATFISNLGLITTSNIGSQSVSYATSAGTANAVAWGNVSSKPSLLMYYQGFTLDANTMDGNSTGFTYSVNAPFTGPIARFSETGYSLQLNAAYSGSGTGIAFRTRNGDAGTFNPWRVILNDANYTAYVPSLAGTGASGTWSISVSGNAATATNVAYSGLTGTVPTWNQNTTGNAATAGSATSAGSVPASGITGQTGMWTSAARPGAYRLYRNDSDDAYNIQTTWSADKASHWSLRGYYNDSYHAPCYVASSGFADNAGQLNTYGYLVGDNWNTYYTSGKLRVASVAGSTSTGAPPSSVHNYGSLLSYGISGEDMFQMYFPDNANNSIANSRKLHYRTGRNTWCDWKTVVDMVGDTLTIVEGGTPKIVVRGSVPYGQPTSASIELVGDADGNQTQSYRWISTAPDWGGQEFRLERKVNNVFQLVGRVPKNTFNLEWQGTIVQGLSDSRVKTNVVSMTEGLDKIDRIRPVTFDWVPTENVSDREGADFGFIAQELEEVLPEVVHTRGDGYKTVMYEKVVPVLVQAMKEQQAMIEALKAEVELLKNK